MALKARILTNFRMTVQKCMQIISDFKTKNWWLQAAKDPGIEAAGSAGARTGPLSHPSSPFFQRRADPGWLA